MCENYKSKNLHHMPEVSYSFAFQQANEGKNEKRGPFFRKKVSNESSVQGKSSVLTNRNTRDMPPLQRKTSIEQLITANSQNTHKKDIKYMSPNLQKTADVPSPNNKHHIHLSQKFIRQTALFSTDISSQCLNSNNYIKSSQKVPTHSLKFQHSKMTNNTENQTDLGDWLKIESENEKLKKQKKKLQKQIYQLKLLLKQAKIELPCDFETIQLQCSICHIKSINLFSVSPKVQSAENSQKLKSIQIKLKDFQRENLKLKLELLEINEKLQCQSRARLQLISMVDFFRNRYEQTQKMLQHLCIKQNVLLRQKAEFQGVKVMTEKINKERQNLRKTLAEYRQKITLLTQAVIKSKRQKEEEIDISLDLSTSIDIY